jgi:hypothetical protein
MESIIENQIRDIVLKVRLEETRVTEFQEKYESMSDEAAAIFHELCETFYPETKGIITEANWLNYVGDVVGILDPTGLVDIANGLSYLYQGDTFFGMLSMISAVPYVGDALAKPFLMAGRGSKIVKDVNAGLKLVKAGKTAEAGKVISDISKSNGMMANLLSKVRQWAPKLKNMIDKIPGGKLSAGLKNTLKDIVSLFEKVGSGSQKASAIARRAAKTTMTAKETETVLKQIQNAVKQDANLFRSFGGNAAKGLQGIKNYKMSGVPRLFGNKATRSLMRRTKFYAGFLDWLGVGNFVGPEELKAKMGANFDEKMNQYSQTSQAKENWESEFGSVPETEAPETSAETQTSSPSSAEDMTKDFISSLLFGPITGKVV